MSEPFREQIKLTSSDVDMFRRLRTSAMFRMFQEISIAHTELLGAGREKTLDKGALWVMTRMRVVTKRPALYDEHITLVSWPGQTMHCVFPRFYRILDANGETLADASGLWALIDAKTRRIVFPDELGVDIEGCQVQNELALPEALAAFEPLEAHTRTAHYCDADLNGHVNNTRYLDWMDDLAGQEFHRAHFWRELQINYQSEIPPGSRVELSARRTYTALQASGAAGGKTAFSFLALAGDC